ncbi:BON domain-containing protein [Tautonia plasticadhaerens]|uniref:BON domain protein n=1 Tax=Tautonia plasticadhaerens TaxID=2527974 RepID=A0A518H106_9BACT|nr:BON domain-containing protein [Tautonia plasticadhaerens]QDV34510.1 BON domain protein [Tautonia plasticadhaerens]
MRTRIDRRRLKVAAPLLAIGLAAAALGPGPPAMGRPQEGEGAGERVGSRVDDLFNSLRKNFEGLSEDVRRRFAEAQQRVEGLGVEARVYSRIRWDKALTDSEIAVEIREGDLAVLHGTVADAELRRKAVRLAVETVGVERVQDLLTVPDAPEPAPTAQP